MVTIIARILVNSIKTGLSINRQIKLSQWNQKAQQIVKHPNAEQENAYLQEFKCRIQNAQSQLFIAKQEITGEMIKALVLGRI